jgi:hypothetical protein
MGSTRRRRRSDPPREPTAQELLELDLDLRQHEALLSALDARRRTEGLLATSMRLSYVYGYLDALGEGVRAQLCREHHLPLPRRGTR